MRAGKQKKEAEKKISRSPAVDETRPEAATDGRPRTANQTRPGEGAGAAGKAENERLLQRQVGNTRRLAPSKRAHVQAPKIQRHSRGKAAIQRKALPQAEGRPLGTLHNPVNPRSGITLFARVEVVPSTAEAGQFAGYTTLEEAEYTARRRPSIAAVLKDYEGRYHVFDTGVPTSTHAPHPSVSPRESGRGYTLVEWVNLTGPQRASKESWAERVKKAHEMLAAFKSTYGRDPRESAEKNARRQDVEQAYKALFAEVLPVAPQELHAIRTLILITGRGKNREEKEVTTASPGLINFDIYQYYEGIAALLDPLSQTPERPGEHTRVSLPENPFELAVPPEPYLSLGPAALNKDSPLTTLGTLVHEEAHVAHKRRTLQLFQEWSATGLNVSFREWLIKEMKNKNRADPITEVDMVLATEPRIADRKRNTETLAEVAGFSAVYHAMPLGVDKETRLGRLPTLAGYWINAETSVQNLSIRKLRHYYERMMDQDHRRAFDDYVGDQLKKAKQAAKDSRLYAMGAFYERLAQFSAK